ncbi:MAG: hypothetical protein R3234_09650, partial [Thermoanaerobaculia bacterium]|nr:hypothetical protein [Thermoanaerobaculia bacterium]
MKRSSRPIPPLLVLLLLLSGSFRSLPADAEAEVGLLADLSTGFKFVGARSLGWAPVGGEVHFFLPRSSTAATELWVTDGTPVGTRLVREWMVHSFPEPGLALPDGRLLFAPDDPDLGKEPWVTDGTPAGTRPLRDLCVGRCDSYEEVRRNGSRVVLRARTENFESHLYQVRESGDPLRLLVARDVREFVLTEELIFFLAENDQRPGLDLWRFDPETTAARFLQSLAPNGRSWMVPFRHGVLLEERDPPASRILFARETEVEVVLELGAGDVVEGTTVPGTAFYSVFRNGDSPDPSCDLVALPEDPGAPVTVLESRPLGGFVGCPRFLTPSDAGVFFTVAASDAEEELWFSGGTVPSTRRLATFPLSPGEFTAQDLTTAGPGLFFIVRGEEEDQLWFSDRTP